MNNSNKLLSDIVAFRTYAKFLPHLGRRESFEETINRNMAMHLDRFPKLSKEILKAYSNVHSTYVMPSMRGMQFAGDAVLKNNVRLYNCSFANIDDIRVFGEAVFILLSGAGFGFSVQQRHVSKLPKVTNPREEGTFVVQDSIIGWAQAVDTLVESYMFGRVRPSFDFSHIRPKGSYLVTTGAKAPGPEPLKKALELVEMKLKAAIGRKLSSIEVYDMVCILSDAVYAGGIRRAALICLFDKHDEEMLKAKQGDWWVKTPWRARSNNSALLLRSETTKEEFEHVYNACKNSGSGEPGFIWSNNLDMGYNPCSEVGLNSLQFCNLTTINQTGITTEKHLMDRVHAATFLGTLQATYTDFPYLRPGWKEVTEKEALLGVSFTGVADNINFITPGLLGKAARYAVEVNQKYAAKLGINPAARITTLKPEGCQNPDTMILTGKGLMALNEIGDISGLQWQDHNLDVAQEDTFVKSTKFYINGEANTKKLQMSSGISLESTANHQYRTLRNGEYVWVRADQLVVGDILPYQLDMWPELNEVKLPLYTKRTDKTKSGATKRDDGIKAQPVTMGEELAFLLGVMFGDGSVHKKGMRIAGGLAKMENLIKCQKIVKKLFDIDAKIVKYTNREDCYSLYITSTGLVRFLSQIGCLKQKAKNIEIPLLIRSSPKAVVLSFINGYISADGCLKHKDVDAWSAATTSRKWAEQLVVLCRAVGVDCKFKVLKTNSGHLGSLPMYQIQSRNSRFRLDQHRYIAREKRAIWKQLESLGLDNFSFDTIETIQDSRCLTYDIEVPTNNCYIANSYVSHNTSSCVLGSSSGIHTRFADYYIRRIRMNKDDALAVYLKNVIPDLVEDDKMGSGVVVSIPQESPKGSLVRSNETALTAFNRAVLYNKHWVANGHVSGDNMHNVSVTISVKEEEWDELREAMWNSRGDYYGVSLLPYDGGTYVQAPFEECSQETFTAMEELIKNIDLKHVREEQDNTNRIEQLACVGGVCEINI